MADKTVTYRLLADITAFKAQMAQAAASVQGAADRMTGATKQGVAFRNTLSTVGKVGGAVGLIAAGGLAVAVKAAADFDQGMSRVQAATHESAANMDLLRAAALKAGADTKFSATEAATGVEALAKAGVATKDILGGGLTGALNLAAAGTIDVGKAADIAATTMNQFGLSGTDVSHIADVLAASASAAQGEVTDMADALQYVGPVASQMGISLEQTVGTITELASQGILGTQAGTALRGMLTALTSPSAIAAKNMKELGISVYDAQGNFVGFDGIAGQLHKTMGDLTKQERDEALGRIFGNEQITAARILYAGGATAVDKWTSGINKSGAAAEMAATKMDNLKGDLEQFKGSLETALIGTGEGTQGPLRGLVQSLTDVVNAYNKLPPAAQSATGAVLGVTALAGGGLFVFSKVVTGVADLRQALTDLGPAGTKAAAGLRAVGTATAIVGGVLILKSAVDGLEKAMRGSVPTTEELAGHLLDLNNGKISDLGKQFEDLGNSLDLMQNPLSGLASFSDMGAGLLPFYTSTNEQVGQLKDQLGGLDAALASIATNGSADQAREAFANLAVAQGLSGDQQKYLLTQLPQYRDALAGVANQTKLTGDASTGAADGIQGIATAASGATPKLQSFKGALAEINGFLDKRQAWRDYQQSVEDWKKSMKDTGATSRATTTAMDGMTRNILQVAQGMNQASRTKFLGGQIHMLEEMAHKSPGAAKALGPIINQLYKAEAGSVHATGAQRDLITQYHLTPKQAATVIKQINMGKSTSDIKALLKQYGLTPAQIHTAVQLTGAQQSIAEIANLRYAMSQLHDKTVFINVARRGGTQVGTNADGNIHEFYASGGYLPRIGDQQPQIRPFSGARGLTWSEQGSGPWEAFISGSPAKADRSKAIATDVVSRLGGQVQFARGGIVGGGSSQSHAGGMTVRIEGPLAIKGRLDLNTGQLMNATLQVVRQELSDDKSFDRAMAGRRS